MTFEDMVEIWAHITASSIRFATKGLYTSQHRVPIVCAPPMDYTEFGPGKSIGGLDETAHLANIKEPVVSDLNTPGTKPSNLGPKWAHEKRRQEGKEREIQI